jgi:hypothetical protein
MTLPANPPDASPTVAVARRPHRPMWPWLRFLVLLFVVAGVVVVVRGLAAPVPKAKSAAGARALVRVPEPQPGILDDAKTSVTAETEAAVLRRQRTHLGILKSGAVLNAVLKQPKVQRLEVLKKVPDPLAWLEDKLEGTFLEDTELLLISFRGADGSPEERATLVNAVADAYMEVANIQEKTQQIALLEDVKGMYERAVLNQEAEREKLRRLARQTGGSDGKSMTVQQAEVLEAYATHRKELAAMRTRLREAQIRLAILEKQLAPREGEGPAAPALRDEHRKAHIEVGVLEDQVKKMEREAPALKEAAEKVGASSFELELRRDEYESNDKILRALREKRDRLMVEVDASKNRVILVYRAEAP